MSRAQRVDDLLAVGSLALSLVVYTEYNGVKGILVSQPRRAPPVTELPQIPLFIL